MSERRKILIAFAVPAVVALTLAGVVLWLVLGNGDEGAPAVLELTQTPASEALSKPTVTATTPPAASATAVPPAPPRASLTEEPTQRPQPSPEPTEAPPPAASTTSPPTFTPVPATATPSPTPVPVMDIAVISIRPSQWPSLSASAFEVEVANTGPALKPGSNFQVACTVTATEYKTNTNSYAAITLPGHISFDVSDAILASQPFQFDFTNFHYSIECSIAAISRTEGFIDPDPRNDDLIWYEPILADLLIKAVFPSSLPKGDLFFQITNQGPGPLTFVTVGAACYGTRTQYTTGTEEDLGWKVQSITLTLAPGETKSFLAGISLDTTTYWYRIACQVQSDDTADPEPMNNVLVVTIPPPP